MLLDLSKIRTPRERFEKVYPPDAIPTGEESFAVVAPVSLAFDIARDKQQFHLVGRIVTTLELPCSRCLEPYALPVDADFNLRYQPHALNVAPGNEAERGIEEDDLSTAFYQNEEIDLLQLMREQFYLALPMKPLCRDDCRGLCPVCGTNLNRAACGCQTGWEDPRMAVLKTLKKES